MNKHCTNCISLCTCLHNNMFSVFDKEACIGVFCDICYSIKEGPSGFICYLDNSLNKNSKVAITALQQI